MKKAIIDDKKCVACGACTDRCPKDAISIFRGITAAVDEDKCVGCTLCTRVCPANAITIQEKNI